MSGYILVDGNSIGHAAHNTTPLSIGDMQTQAIYQFLKMLKTARTRYENIANLVVLWDDRAQWRFDIYPEYKSKRDEDPERVAKKEAYRAQLPYIERALTYMGVSQLTAKGFEADDLAGFLVRRANSKGARVALVSGDGDWFQFVSGRVTCMDPRVKPGRQVDRMNFLKETGFQTGLQFLQAKALHGDISDSITGVGGLGEKAAIEIMQSFGSVPGLVEAYRREGSFTKENLPASLSRFKKKLNDFCAAGLPIFARNMALMNLLSAKHDAAISKAMIRVSAAPDWAAFESLCRELAFVSIYNHLHEWQRVFDGARRAA